ncbi:MAG: hypothetical protein ABJB33_06305 [Gemmatimonadota bacterium]
MNVHFIAFLVIPTLLQAQARCTDTLAGASWRQTPLMATVTLPAAGERDRDRYVAELLHRMAQSYRDPGAALMPDGAMAMVTPVQLRDPIAATLELGLVRGGRVVEARLSRSSGLGSLDSAFVRAARDADRGRGFGRVPRKLKGDTVRFTIAIADGDASAIAARLGALSSAYRSANVPPRLRSMPPARAPHGRRVREVVLAGTVSPAGRMRARSIRLVSATDSALVPVARRSFERAIYQPGTLNGCPAESYIRQTFRFP